MPADGTGFTHKDPLRLKPYTTPQRTEPTGSTTATTRQRISGFTVRLP